jgi:ABC-type transport system involved in cytochrome c biogenesis permease subunit
MMHSTSLYNLSTAGYLMSLGLFAFHIIKTRRYLLQLGVLIIACSFLVQTSGMVMRWIEAGFLEVMAAEKTLGQSLHGWSWFVIFTQHPPWSNLYEIMIYMSWGVIIVTLAIEIKWQIAWVRQVGLVLALMALGMAALTDAAIKPLVPALKSWWIMIHVISASIAYASGAIAAFICLFALMKDARIKKEKFFGFALLFLALLLFAIGGGARLFLEQAYYVKLLAFFGENIVSVIDRSKNGGASFFIPMPGIGYMLMTSIVVHSFFSVFLLLQNEYFALRKIKKIFSICFMVSFICLIVIFIYDLRQSPISIDAGFIHHLTPSGPFFIGFKSHSWGLSLLIFTVLVEGLLLLYLLFPQIFINKLPPVAVLEGASYRAISFCFFLMTIVLITGALWAHYAWGRYWAWDPKETGALAIWLNYAIYLHTRRTAGLSGPTSSLIGVFGFFVIIIGFLGVNLGLFADGLHSYGNG